METGTNLGRRRSRETAGSESSGHGDLIATSRNLHAGHSCLTMRIGWQPWLSQACSHAFERLHARTMSHVISKVPSQRVCLGKCFAKLEDALVTLVTLVMMLWMMTLWLKFRGRPDPRSTAASVATWPRQRNSGGEQTAADPSLPHGHCKASLASPWICAFEKQWKEDMNKNEY